MRSTSNISIGAFMAKSRVNGPGLRSVLWVRGCPFRCSGCFNKDFQEFKNDNLQAPDDIIRWILQVQDTEGVTFSGGEPFAQAGGLAEVAESVRAVGKSVVVFTGYEKEALLSDDDADRKGLLENTDLLITGPYEKDNPCDHHPLVSSANQEVVFTSDRYRHYDFGGKGKRSEIRIRVDGSVEVTGLL